MASTFSAFSLQPSAFLSLPLASGNDLFGVVIFLIIAILSALGKRGQKDATQEMDPLEGWMKEIKKQQEARKSTSETGPPPLPTATPSSQQPPIIVRRVTYQRTSSASARPPPPLPRYASPARVQTVLSRSEPLPQIPRKTFGAPHTPAGVLVQESVQQEPVRIEAPEMPVLESVQQNIQKMMVEARVQRPLDSAEMPAAPAKSWDLSILRSQGGLKQAMVLREILGEPRALSSFPA